MHALSPSHLWCGKALHDGDEGEEVAIGPALEYVGEVDEPAENLGPLQSVPSTHDAQNHCLGETQVSVGGSGNSSTQSHIHCQLLYMYVHVHVYYASHHLYTLHCTVHINIAPSVYYRLHRLYTTHCTVLCVARSVYKYCTICILDIVKSMLL